MYCYHERDNYGKVPEKKEPKRDYEDDYKKDYEEDYEEDYKKDYEDCEEDKKDFKECRKDDHKHSCNPKSACSLKAILEFLDNLNAQDLHTLRNLIDRLLCCRSK
jgi:hypothetical protein